MFGKFSRYTSAGMTYTYRQVLSRVIRVSIGTSSSYLDRPILPEAELIGNRLGTNLLPVLVRRTWYSLFIVVPSLLRFLAS